MDIVLEAMIETFPPEVKAVLSQGPIDEDCGYVQHESCRVCMALRPYQYKGTLVMYALSEWHNEVTEPTVWYLRCVLIYLIAGWDGQ